MIDLILISITILSICVCGISIKILIKKNGQFSGTCASNNPFLKNGDSCPYCGSNSEEECKSEKSGEEGKTKSKRSSVI